MKIIGGSSQPQQPQEPEPEVRAPIAPAVPPPPMVIEKVIEKLVPMPAPVVDLEPLKAQIEEVQRQTTKLAEEISALRAAMVELPAAILKNLPVPAPAPVPVPPPTPAVVITAGWEEPRTESLTEIKDFIGGGESPVPLDLLNALSDPMPDHNPQTKVAIFGKLWDYLNETAFEIPRRKTDRTN